VRSEADQERPKLASLLGAERPEQLALRAPGRLAAALHGAPAGDRELDAMASPVDWVGLASQELPLLELIEQGDEVARLDSQGQREVALGDWALRVQVVEHGEFGPSQPTVTETAAEAPGGSTRQAEDQEAESRAQGGVAGFGVGLGRCLDLAHRGPLSALPSGDALRADAGAVSDFNHL
jgi:hypothetical protein